VAQFWREQEEPSFNEEVVSRPLVEEGEVGNDFDDEIYPQALELVVRTGQASASMIQRYLKIGYNRAARLMDRMEREGVVGPAQGSKPREVLLTPQDLERTPPGEEG
jgi:S-DNA-T family DNA segregation ATPase FtsK/SpoIIIE